MAAARDPVLDSKICMQLPSMYLGGQTVWYYRLFSGAYQKALVRTSATRHSVRDSRSSLYWYGRRVIVLRVVNSQLFTSFNIS